MTKLELIKRKIPLKQQLIQITTEEIADLERELKNCTIGKNISTKT